MNRKLITKTMGLLLSCEAAAMVPSLLLAIYYHESDIRAFVISITVVGLLGLALSYVSLESHNVGYKEGFIIATLGWLLMATFGALPYMLSGSLVSFVDAFFETMSGLTTTGASVISDVEILPHGLLFWRSMTHWLGGMGIIVLTLALIPSLNIAGMSMYQAEVPGPTKSKVLPRVAQTSRQLYKIYVMITIAEVILLVLAGMPIFDAFIHTFGSVATGGFSNKNASVAAYDSILIEVIIIFFMVICGMNFSVHFQLLRRNFKDFLHDRELLAYLFIIVLCILLLSVNLVCIQDYSLGKAVRVTSFQVASIITTTGFATDDFNLWPDMSRFILILLMFIGGCAGSTAGGIKVVRFLIMFKSGARYLLRLSHPKAVVAVRLGKDVIPREVVDGVQNFFFLIMGVYAVSAVILTALGIDFISAISAVAATLFNVGPGLGIVGPMTNFSSMPQTAKALLSFCMLIGRLELYTVLVLLHPKFWR